MPSADDRRWRRLVAVVVLIVVLTGCAKDVSRAIRARGGGTVAVGEEDLHTIETHADDSDSADSTAPISSTATQSQQHHSGNKRKLNILAMGDSLTEGMLMRGRRDHFHPYTLRLANLFRDRIPDLDVNITNVGISGERVVKFMRDRLQRLLEEHKDHFHWAVILGGTNDIGHREGVENLTAALGAMHDACHADRIQTVVVTVPAIKALGMLGMPENLEELRPYLRRSREAVNSFLREYAASHPLASVLFDFHDAIPQYGPRAAEMRGYWSDGIHLNAKGYDRMGELMFETLSPVCMRPFTARL